MNSNTASIVLGLSFGDEGKGNTTSYLCSKYEHLNPLVVRFNGGHQAGHTVNYKEHSHKFSCFGSGTLQGVPTYWSKYCTFFPSAVLNEYEDLKQYKPVLYVDALCPVTTPFDIYSNQQIESKNHHGSVGVGFGETIKRHESMYKLYVQDLFYEDVYKEKLQNIALNYYKHKIDDENIFLNLGNKTLVQVYEDFLKDIEDVKRLITVVNENNVGTLRENNQYIIFEGAQGILLDMDFGFFPYVTRSNTTSKNALSLLPLFGIDKDDTEIFYVTRAYQTRHGNGPMTNENDSFGLINLHTETNHQDDWQGNFRRGILDIDLINYAIECDDCFSHDIIKNLSLTCLDQISKNENGSIIRIPFTIRKEINYGSIAQMIRNINCEFNTMIISESIYSDKILEMCLKSVCV